MAFVLPVLDSMVGTKAWREVFLELAHGSSKESFFLSQGLRTLVARGKTGVETGDWRRLGWRLR